MLDATEHPETRKRRWDDVRVVQRGYCMCSAWFLVAPNLLWLVWVCSMIPTVWEDYSE